MRGVEVEVDRKANVSKAPPETALKKGDRVRVAQDSVHLGEIDGAPRQVWKYGVVRWVHHKLLVDINFDDEDVSRGLPAYAHEVQRAI